MSYCVNCGVELEKGSSQCPLCDTPVINPAEKMQIPEMPAYPQNLKIPKAVNKKYWAFVISLVMIIPNLILLVFNALFFNSVVVPYITGGFFVAWVWFVFPFIWRKPIPFILLAVDILSLMIYVYSIHLIANDSGWYEGIALPVIITAWAIGNAFMLWLRKKRSKTAIVTVSLVAITVLSFVFEACISVLLHNRLSIVISVMIAICCFALAVFFAVLGKSKRLKAWITRKFYM